MANTRPLIRKILSLSVYVLMAIAVAFLIVDRHPPTLAVGTVAPIETNLKMLAGNTLTFKKLLRKPMVINFFASWCPPCLKELPILSKLAKTYRGQISFVGAAVASTPEDIAALKTRFLLDYDLGMAADAVVEKWQAGALPTTYVIDTNGTILWAHSGILTNEQLDQAILLALGR